MGKAGREAKKIVRLAADLDAGADVEVIKSVIRTIAAGEVRTLTDAMMLCRKADAILRRMQP